MSALIFDIVSALAALGAATLARRQLLIVWTLALHICIAHVVALCLIGTHLIDYYDPAYYAMNILFSFAAHIVLYIHWNSKTLLPYLAVLASSITCYVVFFEYFTNSNIFYMSFPLVMSLIITVQIALIAKFGGSIGTVTIYFSKLSRGGYSISPYATSYRHTHMDVIPRYARNEAGYETGNRS